MGPMGPNRYELVKFLLEHNATLNKCTSTGGNLLSIAASSHDSDPKVIKLLIEKMTESKKLQSIINMPLRSGNFKWGAIYSFAFLAHRFGLSRSRLLESLANDVGSTALHYAVQNGDLEICEILLSVGADPLIKNSMGKDAFNCCENFPQLRGLLKKEQRRNELRKRNSNIHETVRFSQAKKKTNFAKRISTATPILHDMWLINLETLLERYGSDGKLNVVEVHQDLKEQGLLVNWRDVSSDSEIVFVTHEWLSWAHPDPNGDQIKVLCTIMERLRSGDIERTTLDGFAQLLYKTSFTTIRSEWMDMLDRTYIWFDWISMPQPSADSEEKIGAERMAQLQRQGSNAIRSIPAYVERSDFMLILVCQVFISFFFLSSHLLNSINPSTNRFPGVII